MTDKDIVFVNGGNTFYLLDWVRKSGFNKVLDSFLKKGGLYVGVSAGSYLACPTIEQATWKRADRNRWGVTDFKALNYVPFLIVAHFEEKYRKIIDETAKKQNIPSSLSSTSKRLLLMVKRLKLSVVVKRSFGMGLKRHRINLFPTTLLLTRLK